VGARNLLEVPKIFVAVRTGACRHGLARQVLQVLVHSNLGGVHRSAEIGDTLVQPIDLGLQIGYLSLSQLLVIERDDQIGDMRSLIRALRGEPDGDHSGRKQLADVDALLEFLELQIQLAIARPSVRIPERRRHRLSLQASRALQRGDKDLAQEIPGTEHDQMRVDHRLNGAVVDEARPIALCLLGRDDLDLSQCRVLWRDQQCSKNQQRRSADDGRCDHLAPAAHDSDQMANAILFTRFFLPDGAEACGDRLGDCWPSAAAPARLSGALDNLDLALCWIRFGHGSS
jgi:hypothetical protein